MTRLAAELGRQNYRYNLEIPIRWSDCDAYGHVNNAIYYAMMDQIVTVWLFAHGVIGPLSESIGLCVASSCEFHQSFEFPEIVDARLRVTRIGDKSVRYEIGLFKQDVEEPASTGHFVHVYVGRHTRQPMSLTHQQRERLSLLLLDAPRR